MSTNLPRGFANSFCQILYIVFLIEASVDKILSWLDVLLYSFIFGTIVTGIDVISTAFSIAVLKSPIQYAILFL